MNQLTPRTRDAVLQIAAWQIGILENPAGSNKVKYAQDYGMNGQPWCVMFVWWCFREAGFNLYKTASCTTLTNRYKAAGQWVTSGFKPGDIVMFDFSGKKGKTEHCGIVESVDKDGNLITIEGNTGAANQSNGGAVMRRARNLKFVTGACRPNYNM